MAFLAQVADVLRILAHPYRLKIVETLEDCGAAPVHRIVAAIDRPQATTSQHLNAMRRAGIIAAERRGREVWYRIDDASAITVLGCIRKKLAGGGNASGDGYPASAEAGKDRQ